MMGLFEVKLPFIHTQKKASPVILKELEVAFKIQPLLKPSRIT
jgi:hypothetical protein